MFRGEEIHKLGPDTYRIVHGAFTTCVQPTPRWEMVVRLGHAEGRTITRC